MKYLGIDYGSKRIGIAVSDAGGRIAFPKPGIRNMGLDKTVEKVSEIIETEEAGAVVIGHSANFKGKDNPIMRDVRQFKDELGRIVGVEIHLEPEFMTSVQASRITGRDERLDSQAAALILQSFLDRLK